MKKFIVLLGLLLIACAHDRSITSSTALGAFTPGQVGPFVIPASWKQTAWFIDNANSTGCASDNNRTCSSSSCTSGDGPCLTYGSIATRWGTYYPKLQQATVVTVIGNMASSDIIYAGPAVEGTSSLLSVSCALPTPTWTGTLGTVTAKNRTTAQLTTAVITAAGVAANQLIINTTHPSYNWTKSNSGTTWTVSEPISGCSAPATSCAPAESDWTNATNNGDTVAGYTLPNIYMVAANPTTNNSINFGYPLSMLFSG